MEKQRDPTEAEIEAACLRIQSKWSAEERQRRIVGPSSPVAVPTFNALDLVEIIHDVEAVPV